MQPQCTDAQCDDGNECTTDNCDPVQGCRHSPDTGVCPVALLGGKKLTIKLYSAKPSKNKVQFQAKGSYSLPPAVDAPTAVGATLRLRDGAGQELSILLPSGLWKGLGKNGSKGFSFKDKKATSGCSSVQLKGGKQIKVSCKGDKITLQPPLVEPVQVILRAGQQSYCASLGGKVNNNGNGTFTATGAAAPTECFAALLPPQ